MRSVLAINSMVSANERSLKYELVNLVGLSQSSLQIKSFHLKGCMLDNQRKSVKF